MGRDAEVAQVVSAAMAWLLDPEQQTGVVWLVGEPGSGRDTVAEEAGRAMMLPVVDDDLDARPRPDGRPTLQRLADQGPLTRGLADVLTEHARSQGRILLVPVTDVEEAGAHERDSLVGIGPLARDEFTRLLGLVLQVKPTPELEAELFDESRGLPGLATHSARARIASGDLTWTTRGVDTARPGRLRSKVFPALVAIPWAILGLFGGEGMVEASAKSSELEQRERRLVLAG